MNPACARLVSSSAVIARSGSTASKIRPSEALVFLSSLILLTDIARQLAIYKLILLESSPLELKLGRWTRALNELPIPPVNGTSVLWSHKERAIHDIDDLREAIHFLQRQRTTSGIAQFLAQLHKVAAGLTHLSSLLDSVRILPKVYEVHAKSQRLPNQLPDTIEEVNGAIDCIYSGVVHVLQEPNVRAAYILRNIRQ
jgi:hypothetical protein